MWLKYVNKNHSCYFIITFDLLESHVHYTESHLSATCQLFQKRRQETWSKGDNSNNFFNTQYHKKKFHNTVTNCNHKIELFKGQKMECI